MTRNLILYIMTVNNSGHRLDDHFVDVTEMIEIGKGGKCERQNYIWIDSSHSFEMTSLLY